MYDFRMEFGKAYRETAAKIRTTGEELSSGVAVLAAVSVLSLGALVLILITGRQLLKAVRAGAGS